MLIRDGDVLLLQRSDDDEIGPGRWQCPAGMQEPCESIGTTLTREVSEETGLTVTRRQVLGTTVTAFHWDGTSFELEQHDFLITTEHTDVVLSSEHQAMAWVELGVACERDDLSPPVRTALDRAASALEADGEAV